MGGDPLSTVRVRHIPAGHPYVEHLLPLLPLRGLPVVHHLPDPPVPGAPAHQWWPHPALEPEWIMRHADDLDVVHTHFGLEGRTPAQLATWLQTLRELGLPLVHTVHDLTNPHLPDQRRHRAQLALLVEHAAALLTLTDGAADEVERTWGRRPLVVPHPHVAPLDLIGLIRPRPRTPLMVGLHLKSLRANLAPLRVLPALAEAVRIADAALPDGARLEVRTHPGVLVDDELGALVDDLAGEAHPHVEVVTSPRLSDAQLWSYLRRLDVSVLPYAWGTHSGWVEACRDLGTWVLAADVGHLRDQAPLLAWGEPTRPPRVELLVALLTEAATTRAPTITRARREEQRQDIAAHHARVYSSVLTRRRRPGGLA